MMKAWDGNVYLISLFVFSLFPYQGCSAYCNEDSEFDSESEELTTQRIVGGWKADIKEHPYQASLEKKGKHFCGGSIITKYFILTAGHCTQDMHASEISVRVGSTYREKGGQLIGVYRIYNHPNFVPDNFDNDIAILELKNTIKFSSSVIPIDLAEASDPPLMPGELAVVSGWGRLREYSKTQSSHFMAVYVPIVSIKSCQRSYPQYDITDSMLCAGYSAGGYDACAGDSGGPLVIDDVQVGIVSWGVGCASPDSPGVYASISKLRHFIDEIIF